MVDVSVPKASGYLTVKSSAEEWKGDQLLY